MTELKKQLCLAGPLVLVSFLQTSLLMICHVYWPSWGAFSVKLFYGYLLFWSHRFQFHGKSTCHKICFSISLPHIILHVNIWYVEILFAWINVCFYLIKLILLFSAISFHEQLGIGSALETFCGQAYGAKQYHMLGVYMQRAMLVVTLMCIPIDVLWSCTEQIFRSLKQDPVIAARAGLYSQWLIPSIFPCGLLQCQLRFLQTQNNIWPLVITTGITIFVHVLVCWTLNFRFDFGSKGAALSNTISYWTNVLILAIYIKFSHSCQKTWRGFSKKAWKISLAF